MSKVSKLLVFVLLMAVISCGKAENIPGDLSEFHGATMGTTYSVKVVMPATLSRDQVKSGIEATLKKVNKLMSTYDPDSEISRFNDSDGDQWFPVSPETHRVLQVAVTIGSLSSGALDVTVGPLVNLWGFGPDKRPNLVPSPDELNQAREFTGLKRIRIKENPLAIWKERKEVYCDLSAVAKGFGVDLVTENLTEMGIESCMVEVGGEVRAVGHKPDGQVWRIGVAVPDGTQRVSRVIEISKMAMATSGDYQNYYEIDGRRYSHTIDPQTGSPIEHNLASVTVLADSCALADAWATALNVMGAEKGIVLAEEQGLPVIFIVRESTGFTERHSSAMKRYLEGSDDDNR